VVRDYILDCLRYWVTEMHVDGFRFDLASILGRGRDGIVLSNPPLLERIAADPILAKTKLIAEAWDAAGLYQVGSFPAWGRWAEWNGKFRDDIRRFVKGDPGMAAVLATRLSGSADLYQTSGREPFHSINFVTCHDGFTLADLVSFNERHNHPNGERNRDGSADDWSWNCGVEGPTDSLGIVALRRRQMKNLAALLLLSHGTPMILAGDEIGRTQSGNNNAYCQDNHTVWMDWRLLESNAEMFRFFRNLIALRRRHALLRRATFVPGGDGPHTVIEWHGVEQNEPDWSWESRLVACHQFEAVGAEQAEHLYIIANAYWESHDCALPPLASGGWRRVVDTSLAPPDDCADDDGAWGPGIHTSYRVGPRSIAVLTRRPDRKGQNTCPPFPSAPIKT
jgi:isoamylase